MRFSELLIAEAAWLAAAMTGAWVLQRITRNAGWVDAVWSAATGIAAACGCLLLEDGVPARHYLVAAMAGAWSGRLAFHIARRSFGAAHEDARYAAFRRDWGASFELKLYVFLLIQAFAAWILVAAVIAAAANPAPALGVLDAAGLAILVGSVVLEGVADEQLHRFKAAKLGPICNTGLWAWSRHPNYFFEFCAWCAYPVIGFSTGPEVLQCAAGPVLMFWLLRYVSGVPPLEIAMRRSRGEAWVAYCARTSIFFPFPPKRSAP